VSDALPDGWHNVRNIGPVTVLQLQSLGIHTPAQFFDLGAAEVYVRLKQANPTRITRTMLWALAGAELDMDWRQVPASIKDELDRDVSQRSRQRQGDLPTSPDR
jgi:DNA transformation protein